MIRKSYFIWALGLAALSCSNGDRAHLRNGQLAGYSTVRGSTGVRGLQSGQSRLVAALVRDCGQTFSQDPLGVSQQLSTSSTLRSRSSADISTSLPTGGLRGNTGAVVLYQVDDVLGRGYNPFAYDRRRQADIIVRPLSSSPVVGLKPMASQIAWAAQGRLLVTTLTDGSPGRNVFIYPVSHSGGLGTPWQFGVGSSPTSITSAVTDFGEFIVVTTREGLSMFKVWYSDDPNAFPEPRPYRFAEPHGLGTIYDAEFTPNGDWLVVSSSFTRSESFNRSGGMLAWCEARKNSETMSGRQSYGRNPFNLGRGCYPGNSTWQAGLGGRYPRNIGNGVQRISQGVPTHLAISNTISAGIVGNSDIMIFERPNVPSIEYDRDAPYQTGLLDDNMWNRGNGDATARRYTDIGLHPLINPPNIITLSGNGLQVRSMENTGVWGRGGERGNTIDSFPVGNRPVALSIDPGKDVDPTFVAVADDQGQSIIVTRLNSMSVDPPAEGNRSHVNGCPIDLSIAPYYDLRPAPADTASDTAGTNGSAGTQ